MSVPDHLIEKAAEVYRVAFAYGVDPLRAALDAVADELRAEGARAERERCAAWMEGALPGVLARTCDGTTVEQEQRIADAVVALLREGVRDAS